MNKLEERFNKEIGNRKFNFTEMNKSDNFKRLARNLRKPDEERRQLDAVVSKPIVDRTYEFAKPDNEIVVTLENGHIERFWIQGLTDNEYIERARIPP